MYTSIPTSLTTSLTTCLTTHARCTAAWLELLLEPILFPTHPAHQGRGRFINCGLPLHRGQVPEGRQPSAAWLLRVKAPGGLMGLYSVLPCPLRTLGVGPSPAWGGLGCLRKEDKARLPLQA